MATKDVSAFRLSNEAVVMLQIMADSENRNLSNMVEVIIRGEFARRRLKLPDPLPELNKQQKSPPKPKKPKE